MSALPRVFCLNPALLAQGRERARSGGSDLRPALAALKADAEEALNVVPCSVMDKTQAPPSGDKHDYLSYGPYWWPDPEKPDGLPYIRRDGQVNPEARSDRSDRVSLARMTEAVEALALAYFVEREPRYAAHAGRLLRTWFTVPATRMNPHLTYGQAIPGRVEGRGIGIIDTARLSGLVDAIGLLDGAPSWGPGDQAEVVAWFAAYLDWLQHSEHGRDEDRARNNHGTWYDVQVASFALFVGREALAARVVREGRERRIATQVLPDGRQPYELARTKALGYSIANLRGLFCLAEIGQGIGIDVWGYRSTDGRSIRAALDYLAPFADPALPWPYPQIEALPRVRLYPLLRRAAIAYGDAAYEAWIGRLPADEVAVQRAQILYPQQ